MPVRRIISGGQTGVDRAALETAIALGIEHGGWCPRGRRAEDGRIDDRYGLRETESPHYHVRTRRNVADSDATLVLCRGPLVGGTALTAAIARELGRPCLVVDLDQPLDAAAFVAWLQREHIETLNVAGPRESQSPGVYAAALAWLRAALGI